MNELTTTSRQLPDTLPDLTRFALIGREKLKAVRAEIRAIEKVGLAKEVHEQKLHEAQEIAEAVTDAEVRMGELLDKANINGGDRKTVQSRSRTTLKDIGISRDQSSQFQLMASHPESVEKAKERARENGEVLSRSSVLRQISDDTPPSKPLFQQELEKAKERHDEFVQSDDQIISVTAIMQDRQDMKLIEYDLMQDIYKALSSVAALNITRSHDEILEVARNMSEERLNETIHRIQNAGRVISQILGIFMEVVD